MKFLLGRVILSGSIRSAARGQIACRERTSIRTAVQAARVMGSAGSFPE